MIRELVPLAAAMMAGWWGSRKWERAGRKVDELARIEGTAAGEDVAGAADLARCELCGSAMPRLGEGELQSRQRRVAGLRCPSASEVACCPSGRARRTQRHREVAQDVRDAPPCNHRIEHLADVMVFRMNSRAKAKAGPAAHDLLGAIDHRPDLRALGQVRDRIVGRAKLLKRVRHGLAELPAHLCQPVGQFCVIAHGRIPPRAAEPVPLAAADQRPRVPTEPC